MGRKNENNGKKAGFYVIGSIALAAGAFIAMPKIIDVLSVRMYRINPATKVNDDVDLGPEIIRKETEDKRYGNL